MKKFLSLILAAVMLAAALPVIAAESDLPFTDVGAKKWYYDAVATAYTEGIMQGKTDTAFAPMENMTRAQLVTILSRLVFADTAGKGASLTFSDVKAKAWYADAVGWAVEKGLVTGYEDNTFRPNANVLRQELAVLFARFLDFYFIELPEESTATLADSKKFPKWAADSINKLCLTGLVGGDQNGKFNPKASATRAEIATILTRYLTAYEKAPDPMTKRLENAKVIAGNGSMAVIGFDDSYDVNNDYFSETFLTSLGLDASKYSVSPLDDEALKSITEQLQKTEDGKFFPLRLELAITNNETGESTEAMAVSFRMYNYVHVMEFIDPDAFDPDYGEGYLDAMKDEALCNVGEIGRFKTLFDKLSAGEEVTVAYLGGSITAGTGARNDYCFAQQTTNYLVKHFPDAKINHVNAGIGGTRSDFGGIRVNDDVLSHSPDTVFIEYAVNDAWPGDDYIREALESLLRTVLGAESSPAVVLIISFKGDMEYDPNNSTFFKDIGKHYGIPVIDVHNPVLRGINDGKYTFDEYVPDGIHPSAFGYSLMASLITNLYTVIEEKLESASADELKVTPLSDIKPMQGARYENLTLLNHTNFTPDSLGGWTDDYTNKFHSLDGWQHKPAMGNEAFEFTLTAKNVFLSVTPNNTSAYFDVSIDGGESFKVYSNDPSRLIFSSDEAETHKYSIRIGEGSEDTDLEIYGIAYN
ncbi:MAG: S-layer homology domain-containing protein [Clostridia bacterium]|nr:S-layer homology domain-containing protein [Clostridia bacterium]